jgi:hypothetical protein
MMIASRILWSQRYDHVFLTDDHVTFIARSLTRCKGCCAPLSTSFRSHLFWWKWSMRISVTSMGLFCPSPKSSKPYVHILYHYFFLCTMEHLAIISITFSNKHQSTPKKESAFLNLNVYWYQKAERIDRSSSFFCSSGLPCTSTQIFYEIMGFLSVSDTYTFVSDCE